MPGGQTTIIVGGGIQPIPAFTKFNIPMWADTIGGTIQDSILRQAQLPNAIVVGTLDPAAGANETFRTTGGLISTGLFGGVAATQSVSIGQNVTFGDNSKSVVIGANTVVGLASGDANGDVVVGFGASSASTKNVVVGGGASSTGGSTVCIGSGAVATGGVGVCIGQGASTLGAAGCMAIGAATIASASNSLAIGNAASANTSQNAHCIGNGSSCAGGNSLAVGSSCSIVQTGNFTESIVVGRNSTVAATTSMGICIGVNSNVSSTHDLSIAIGHRINTDQTRQLKIGHGTGNLSPSSLTTVFIGGPDTEAGYAGITYRHVNGTGNNNAVGACTFIAPRSTGNIATGGFAFQTGAPTGVAANLQAAVTQFSILPSAGGAAAFSVVFGNVTNGAAAAVGTLANAPAAGNPTFWLPVGINALGVKYIPCW